MNEGRARAEVYGRSAGVCEAGTGQRATEWSHRVDRSHGGLWTPWNGLHLSRVAHALAHAHPREADEAGVRLVHRGPHVRPEDVPVYRWHAEHAAFGWWLLQPADDGGSHLSVPVDAEEFGLPERPAFADLVAGLAVGV